MSTLNRHHEPAPTRLLPELLDLIAAELYRETRDDVAACSLVCKEFQASFRPFIFREIDIGNENLERFATLLRSSPHIGAYVRVLSIYSDWTWDNWEEDFSTIAHRLINLQDVDLVIDPSQTVVYTDTFRRAIACILSYPSIRSMSLRDATVFAISPRLLLASLEKMEVIASYDPSNDPNNHLEYWENLDAAYLNLLDSSAAKERLEAPTKCRLTYHWESDPTQAWVSHVLAVQPTAFANLTTLTLHHVRNLSNVQTVLGLAGAGLQILDISLEFITKGSPCHIPLDLSHNTSLQEVVLRHEREYGSAATYTLMPQTGLSIVETSLKTVNAPSLRDMRIDIVQLECCGDLQESPHLQRFDASFANFSKRHPHLRHLEPTIGFGRYPGCKDRITCIRSALRHKPSNHKPTIKGHFPFLTTEKPVHLEVDLTLYSEHKPPL